MVSATPGLFDLKFQLTPGVHGSRDVAKFSGFLGDDIYFFCSIRYHYIIQTNEKRGGGVIKFQI